MKKIVVLGSTNAAGDTFNGAFVVALTEGKGCAEAIAFAHSVIQL